MPRTAAALLLAVLALSCGSGSEGTLTTEDLRDDPLLGAELAGTANPRIADETSGDRPGVTVLMDVTGDWNAVSVELAEAAQVAGWTITAVNCVGSGNDVIGKKQVDGTWLLLEAGAGTRGAGIIIRYDPEQRAPDAFASFGRCPDALVIAARDR